MTSAESMTEVAELRHHYEAVIDNEPLSLDPEFLEYVHATGALKVRFLDRQEAISVRSQCPGLAQR